MKKIFALLVTAFVAAAVHAADPFPEISVADVNAAAKAKSAVIIDVNGTDSYNAGHVPGALNYEAIQDKFAANLPKDKDALVIAYCANPKCGAYARAATAAKKLGYTNVKHMTAGIAGWKDAGMKTEPGKKS
jgi:rhodanese-related sulfurtransferase